MRSEGKERNEAKKRVVEKRIEKANQNSKEIAEKIAKFQKEHEEIDKIKEQYEQKLEVITTLCEKQEKRVLKKLLKNEPGPSGLVYEIQEINEPGPSGIVSAFDYSSLVQNSNETTGFKSDLLQELNNEFNTEEQSIFVNSFYSYLNHHPTQDFVIDLDIVYKFIGFTNKGNFKRLLEKNFSEGTDYQIVFLPKEKNSTGRPKQNIMLNVDTFKGLCMLARTEQAKIIRTYYIKLESIVMKVINKSRQIQPVQKQSDFNQDQINISNRLLDYFRDKSNVIYTFSFNHQDFGLLDKIGIVRETRVFHERFQEHQSEFGNEICINSVIQCNNISQVEKDFKETSLFKTNKVKVPRKNGDGHHTEIVKLTPLVTTESITSEIKRIAGDRMLDPPPMYIENTQVNSLEIEKERTRQIEIQEETKQSQELTKRMELEFEMLKFKVANNIR
jgi:phage anti-repressor protein